ncbi:Ras GTPase activating protein ira2 [Geranomyces variabilis]|uniref:Ras GTPase activating protein ira2 n=1 Tax=Geranomyces variabilis TaxID=109894 RepID=A0AAD5XJP5_9FUNG|nr:Ras GTPase activating protein ira2 [Geranomyces variabilis]
MRPKTNTLTRGGSEALLDKVSQPPPNEQRIAELLLDNNANLLAVICQATFVGDTAASVSLDVLALLRRQSGRATEAFLKRLLRSRIEGYREYCEEASFTGADGMATMLLNAFARYEGLHYLSLSLTEPLRDILPFVSGCEIDPQKFPPDMDESAMEDAQAENEARLKSACSRLLTGVVERQSAMPDSLKRMCKYLREIVDEIYREAAAINAAAAEAEREGQAAETLVGEEGSDAAGAAAMSVGTVLPAGDSSLAALSEDSGGGGSGTIATAAPADPARANESKTAAVSEESLNRTQTEGGDTAPPTPYAVTQAPQLPVPVEPSAVTNSADDVSLSRKETLTQEPQQISRSPTERELGGESAATTTTTSTAAATTTGASAVAPSSPSMSGFRLFGRLVGRRPSACSASSEQDDQVATDAADAGFPSQPQRVSQRGSRSSYQHSRSYSVENQIARRRTESSTASWPRHSPNPADLTQLSSDASLPAASTPSASEGSVARVKTLPGGAAAAPAFTTGRKRGTSFASFRSQMPPVAPRTSMGYLTVPEKVVGSFLFLRFFVPAITSPDTYGLIEGRVQPSARRGLVLCGKVLTAMCNDVDFGNKEQYLMCLNHFLRENREKVKDFLVYASASDTEADGQAPIPPAKTTEALGSSPALAATSVPDPPSVASSYPRQSPSSSIKPHTPNRPASPRLTLRKAISRSMPSLKPDPEIPSNTTPTPRRFPLIKSESLPRSRSNSTNKLPAGDGVASSLPSSSATSTKAGGTTPSLTGQHSFYAYLTKSLGKIEHDIEEMLFELTPEESEGLLASFFELKRILTGSEGYYASGATGAGVAGGVGGSPGSFGSGGAVARQQAVGAERLKSKSGTIFAKLSAKWGWKGLFNGANANSSPTALGQRPKAEATTRSLGDLTSLHAAGASGGGRSGSGGAAIGPHKPPPGPSHLSREMLASDASSGAQGFGRA